MTTLDTSDLNSPSRPTPDQIKATQPDTLDRILLGGIAGYQADKYRVFFSIDSTKQAIIAHFLRIIEGCKPEKRTDRCCSGGECAVQARIDTWNWATDTYHTNLIKQVKGEK